MDTIVIYKGEHYGPQVIDFDTSPTEPAYALPATVRVRVFPLATGVSVIAHDATVIDRTAGTAPLEFSKAETDVLMIGGLYGLQFVNTEDDDFVLREFVVSVRMMATEPA